MTLRGTGLRRIAIAAAALGCVALTGGCVVVSVDESSVFAPVPYDAEMAGRNAERFTHESAFASQEAWTASWEARAARGGVAGPPPPFAPTEVTHGRLPAGGSELAWTMLKREGAARPLIVRCGGNASTRQHHAFVYGATAVPHGDVLLFDYPGSGETGGEASTAAFEGMGDALAAFVAKEAEGRPLVMWGHSLGGFVCSDLARRLPQTDGVIFEGSARNADKVADAWKPWYLGPIVQVRVAEGLGGYDNASALKAMPGPVLVLGGRKDKTLPVKLSRDLARTLEAQGSRVEYVEFPAGGHSNFPAQADFAASVSRFFAQVK